MMNILVLMKQTFDTEEQVNIKDNTISEDGVKFVVNPYDEYAIEEAVATKEKFGGEVTVLTVGLDRAEEALRTALAMGSDQAVLIENDGLPDDENVIAKVIRKYIEQNDNKFDLIIGGYMSVDNGSAQVGPRVAEELEIPHISTVVSMEIQDNKVLVERDVEGSTEYIEVEFPVLITAQQDLNEPRYPSLPAMMKAKRKPLKRLTVDDLGLSEEEKKTQLKLVGYKFPPKRRGGKILEGTLEEQAKELAKIFADKRLI